MERDHGNDIISIYNLSFVYNLKYIIYFTMTMISIIFGDFLGSIKCLIIVYK